MAILLKRGTIVTMNARREVLRDHDILLEGDRIERIAPSGLIEKRDGVQELSCEDKIIIPGFVSAHSHLSGIFQRGLWDEISFESWSSKSFAMESLINFSAEEIYLLHCASCIEFIRHGVTTVLDMFTPSPHSALEKVESACRALLDTGIRGVLAYTLRDQSPDNKGVIVTPATAEDLIEVARAVAERVSGLNSRLGFMLAPSAPQRCSDRLLTLCRKLGEELGAAIHTHLAETKTHAEIGRAMYGEPIVVHLEKIGFLSPSLSVAHAIWLAKDEMSLLKKHDVKVVHNPGSNMKLGSGTARVKEMIGEGISVGLGADSVNAGTVYSIFEQMKLAVLMPRCVWGPEKWVLPEDAFEMGNLGGARALLLGQQIGSIEEGKNADLVTLNPSSVLLPMNDLVNQLVLAENGNSVDSVFVDGKALMLKGRIQMVSEEEIRAQLSSLTTRIRKTKEAVSAGKA